MNPAHTLALCFPKIHTNIILPSTPRFTNHLSLSLLQVFRPKLCMHFSPVPCVLHAPPVSFPLISSPQNICWSALTLLPSPYTCPLRSHKTVASLYVALKNHKLQFCGRCYAQVSIPPQPQNSVSLLSLTSFGSSLAVCCPLLNLFPCECQLTWKKADKFHNISSHLLFFSFPRNTRVYQKVSVLSR
jgi:hypothetical protein